MIDDVLSELGSVVVVCVYVEVQREGGSGGAVYECAVGPRVGGKAGLEAVRAVSPVELGAREG